MFTLNNPKWQQAKTLFESPVIKVLVGAIEAGASGTTHYQGYLELESPRALSALKKICPQGHFEIRRGTRQQALSYCTKTCSKEHLLHTCADTSFDMVLHGNGEGMDFPLPRIIAKGFDGTLEDFISSLEPKKSVPLGERLTLIREKILNGATDLELANDHFVEWCRYKNSFKEYRLLITPPRNFQTKVVIIQGPTGTGKSRYCTETFPGAYWKPRNEWWDGYVHQEVVVLDEFYGWLAYDFLLRLCDWHPLIVGCKGGSLQFVSKTIVITTNKRPDQWYRNVYFEAFKRRIDTIMVFGTAFRSTYSRYEDAKFIDLHDEDKLGDINNPILL